MPVARGAPRRPRWRVWMRRMLRARLRGAVIRRMKVPAWVISGKGRVRRMRMRGLGMWRRKG